MLKILNLSEGFEPIKFHGIEYIKHSVTTFPDNTPHFRLENVEQLKDCQKLLITTRIKDGNDLFLLKMVMDVLDQNKIIHEGLKINLILPYFPGARQDKRDDENLDPLSSKIYADFINDLNFDSVLIFDAHSPTILALLNRCREIPQEVIAPVLFNMLLNNFEVDVSKVVFISPDAGASHKTHKVVKAISTLKNYNFDLIQGQKRRDPVTGEISGFAVLVHNGGLEGKHCIIVDDTCSNGGTFLGLAAKLKEKGAEKVFLITSHFDGGTDLEKTIRLIENLDGYVTTNSIWKCSDWTLREFDKFLEWKIDMQLL